MKNRIKWFSNDKKFIQFVWAADSNWTEHFFTLGQSLPKCYTNRFMNLIVGSWRSESAAEKVIHSILWISFEQIRRAKIKFISIANAIHMYHLYSTLLSHCRNRTEFYRCSGAENSLYPFARYLFMNEINMHMNVCQEEIKMCSHFNCFYFPSHADSICEVKRMLHTASEWKESKENGEKKRTTHEQIRLYEWMNMTDCDARR